MPQKTIENQIEFRKELVKRFFHPESYFFLSLSTHLKDTNAFSVGLRDDDYLLIGQVVDAFVQADDPEGILQRLAELRRFEDFAVALDDGIEFLKEPGLGAREMKQAIERIATELVSVLVDVLQDEAASARLTELMEIGTGETPPAANGAPNIADYDLTDDDEAGAAEEAANDRSKYDALDFDDDLFNIADFSDADVVEDPQAKANPAAGDAESLDLPGDEPPDESVDTPEPSAHDDELLAAPSFEEELFGTSDAADETPTEPASEIEPDAAADLPGPSFDEDLPEIPAASADAEPATDTEPPAADLPGDDFADFQFDAPDEPETDAPKQTDSAPEPEPDAAADLPGPSFDEDLHEMPAASAEAEPATDTEPPAADLPGDDFAGFEFDAADEPETDAPKQTDSAPEPEPDAAADLPGPSFDEDLHEMPAASAEAETAPDPEPPAADLPGDDFADFEFDTPDEPETDAPKQTDSAAETEPDAAADLPAPSFEEDLPEIPAESADAQPARDPEPSAADLPGPSIDEDIPGMSADVAGDAETSATDVPAAPDSPAPEPPESDVDAIADLPGLSFDDEPEAEPAEPDPISDESADFSDFEIDADPQADETEALPPVDDHKTVADLTEAATDTPGGAEIPDAEPASAAQDDSRPAEDEPDPAFGGLTFGSEGTVELEEDVPPAATSASTPASQEFEDPARELQAEFGDLPPVDEPELARPEDTEPPQEDIGEPVGEAAEEPADEPVSTGERPDIPENEDPFSREAAAGAALAAEETGTDLPVPRMSGAVDDSAADAGEAPAGQADEQQEPPEETAAAAEDEAEFTEEEEVEPIAFSIEAELPPGSYSLSEPQNLKNAFISEALAQLESARDLAETITPGKPSRTGLKALRKAYLDLRESAMIHGFEEAEEIAHKTQALLERFLADAYLPGSGLLALLAALQDVIRPALAERVDATTARALRQMAHTLRGALETPETLAGQPADAEPAAAPEPPDPEESEDTQPTVTEVEAESEAEPEEDRKDPPPAEDGPEPAERTGDTSEPEVIDEAETGPLLLPGEDDPELLKLIREVAGEAASRPSVPAGDPAESGGEARDVFRTEAAMYFDVIREHAGQLRANPNNRLSLENIELAAYSLKSLANRLALSDLVRIPELIEELVGKVILLRLPLREAPLQSIEKGFSLLQKIADKGDGGSHPDEDLENELLRLTRSIEELDAPDSAETGTTPEKRQSRGAGRKSFQLRRRGTPRKRDGDSPGDT